MFVRRLTTWAEATATRDRWNELSDSVPFRRFEWLGNWWSHFGEGHSCYVPTVYDHGGEIVGIAPWFVRQIPALGRVIRFLGSGDVCSDHLSLLCDPTHGAAVATALADWLMAANRHNESDAWDMLKFEGVSCSDPMMNHLLTELEQRGCVIHRQNGADVWRVPLPANWDEYRGQLSKPNRRRVREVQQRWIDSGEAQVHVIESREQFEQAWSVFTELHQRRRQSLGQSGCFANPTFEKFLYQAALDFLETRQLEMAWIEAAGKPMAAHLGFVGDKVTYAYQVGIEPTMLAESPGWLLHSESIKRAIQNGHHSFDFLRGDEPYKRHMGAKSCGMMSVRVVPPRIAHKILNQALVTGTAVKNWLKTRLHLAGISQ